jgi:general secretion pathway protein M
VGPEALAQWLSQARLNARLLPVESLLQRSGEGPAQRWSGTVVLAGTALADSP